MSRERELVMEIQVAGRTFHKEEETLTLIGDEAEILKAYFAEKTVKNESLKDGTYQYTFEKVTSTDNKTKRSNVAKAIHKSINDELSSQHKEVKLIDITKVINEKETGKKWPLQSHAKDSTLTFDQYKNETKTYYKKITSAPMGYQVYLITETKNLKNKKVKLKIHEKESDLKLLKTKDDVLPVLVFAKKEDTITETEASDWIEIEVKEESGNKEGDDLFLYKEENEKKIEVGIKKIHLRPKEDKIKTDGEDAHKSFEGWQEALYIREDETKDGKDAIEAAKTLKTVRDADKGSTTLAFDENAAKKSYPKKISGPANIGILGKDAVFTIDEYKSTATTEDKNNIRWCIYVDKKSTVIKDKSKAGLYTYAKSELVDVVETTAANGTVTKTGGTNKLTIVFDKALEGKTVQIEPYRGSPDHKVSKDWVYENTVKGNKISKRKTTSLWLMSQCESVENTNTPIKKDFNGALKLITPDTIHIYHNGHISKLEFEELKKVKYRYYDSSGDSFHICDGDLLTVKKKANGKHVTSFRTETPSNTIDYKSKNVSGVDAKTSKVYSDGTVITEGKKYGQSNYKIKYEGLSEEIVLVHMKKLNRSNKPVMKFHFHQTLREYSNPYYFAAFIGVLAEVEFDVSCGGSCYEDGSSFPSLEHSNGFAIDTGYKYKKAEDNKIIAGMKKFGFTKRIRGSTTYLDTLTGHTKRDSGSLHDTHLHCGVLVINEK